MLGFHGYVPLRGIFFSNVVLSNLNGQHEALVASLNLFDFPHIQNNLVAITCVTITFWLPAPNVLKGYKVVISSVFPWFFSMHT